MPSETSSDQASSCNHSTIRYTSSSQAAKVGYRRPTDQQRATAAGRKKIEETESELLFPAPLLLPGDELWFDPRSPPQSLRSWVREKERNEVTCDKNVLYVAGPPETDSDVEYIRAWTVPGGQSTATGARQAQLGLPDVVDYLAAFYHGVQVKTLPPKTLNYSQWGNRRGRKSQAMPRFIGLNANSESVRIRVRHSPDGAFQGQLNLDDLLDTAISILPDDAYALLMLVEHDLFEDEDDDFCCGRAYGGSRVAVVSMARYNPSLDLSQDMEREHAWPASHCEAYVQRCCEEHAIQTGTPLKKPAQRPETVSGSASNIDSYPASKTPLQSAVAAHATVPTPALSGMWLSRVCQTASHELGHCFGMDHCVYYACAMQSTSCLAEDVRQPPYLCPVDLAKVLRATGADEMERYEALQSFCTRYTHVPMFAAFGAWLEVRLEKYGKHTKSSYPKAGSRGKPIEL